MTKPLQLIVKPTVCPSVNPLGPGSHGVAHGALEGGIIKRREPPEPMSEDPKADVLTSI